MDKKNISFTNINGEEIGIIAGYASVFNLVDQHNDLIKPGAFKKLKAKKIKLLWQHKAEDPIGVIEEIYEDQHGLYFKAKLLLELPKAKLAYNLIKAEAISGVSIGFRVLNSYHKDEVRIIEDIDLWEISLVTFPANMEANILEIKNQHNLGKNMQENNEQQQAWENFKSINDDKSSNVSIGIIHSSRFSICSGVNAIDLFLSSSFVSEILSFLLDSETLLLLRSMSLLS